MTDPLRGRRIALLIEDDFDDREATSALDLLRAAGADVRIVAPNAAASYKGRRGDVVLQSDISASRASLKDFDAFVIPGGYAPDRLRMRHAAVDLVHDAIAASKPVAAIGHGPQLLISAASVRGRTLTCWPSIAIDLINAGALYVDRPVVEDGPVITARKVDDVAQLVGALARALAGSNGDARARF